MAQDPYRYFRVEARDLLDQFAKGVLELEKNGSNTALIQRLLRLAHTLKGAARVVKQLEIANRTHAIEDVLSPFRDATGVVAREQIDAMLSHLDAIGNGIRMLLPAGGERPEEGKAVPDDGPRTVQADIAEMDAVLDGVAELHAILNGLRSTAREMDQAQRLADLRLRNSRRRERRARVDNPAEILSICSQSRRSFAERSAA
jgi:two-component system, chemotaxis family, sensor kinase CheA